MTSHLLRSRLVEYCFFVSTRVIETLNVSTVDAAVLITECHLALSINRMYPYSSKFKRQKRKEGFRVLCEVGEYFVWDHMIYWKVVQPLNEVQEFV